jgi:hypothetical protein
MVSARMLWYYHDPSWCCCMLAYSQDRGIGDGLRNGMAEWLVVHPT